MNRVLLLDDNRDFAEFLETMFREEGYEVWAYTSPYAALAAAEELTFSVIVTDLGLPGVGGTNLVEQFRNAAPATPIVVLSGYYFSSMLEELQAAGATDALGKPFPFTDLLRKVRALDRQMSMPHPLVNASANLPGRTTVPGALSAG